jgi:hypothetical protein
MDNTFACMFTPPCPYHVYAGANYTKKQMYVGVSIDPPTRICGAHCKGRTVALQDWDCDADDIRWSHIRSFATQSEASAFAHAFERCTPLPPGWCVHHTAGV